MPLLRSDALRSHMCPSRDVIGGTSIGAFFGALYARCDCDQELFEREARKFAIEDMGSISKKLVDITLPIASWFTGRGFNAGLQAVFDDATIETLHLPFFCVSTNVASAATGAMCVHRTGPVWRFVRASMSLAGFLPPISDAKTNSLLLDGGYSNNLPCDVARGMGVSTIIAVDVGYVEEAEDYFYGDELSGLTLLWLRLVRNIKQWVGGSASARARPPSLPGVARSSQNADTAAAAAAAALADSVSPPPQPIMLPSLSELQYRLFYVGNVQQASESVERGEIDLYIRPPVNRVGTMQFGAFDQLVETGYRFSKAVLSRWLRLNPPGLLRADSTSKS